MKQPSIIEVQIDELVLRGFPASTRFRIAAALQSELAQLLQRGKTAGNRRPGPVRLSSDASPKAIGRELARSVHREVAPAVASAKRGRV